MQPRPTAVLSGSKTTVATTFASAPRVTTKLTATLVVALATYTLVAGCGSDRYIVIGTTKAPSASGFVEIEHDNASGATFEVHMEQLHPVSQLDPSRACYVVWVEQTGQAPARVGVLRYNPDERSGVLKHARANSRKFVVKITAEATPTPKAPSDFAVASEEIKLDN